MNNVNQKGERYIMNDLKKKFFEENFQTENELIVLDRKMESVAGHIEVVYFMGGEGYKDVVEKSELQEDIDAYYGAIEKRAQAVAEILKANVESVNSQQGSIDLKIEGGRALHLANEWVNHILEILSID